MSFTEKISDKVWKFKADSNVYLIKNEDPVIIDTGRNSNKNELKKEISKIISIEKVKKILLTHLHYDHIGNIDIFPNTSVFVSNSAIEDLKEFGFGAVLNHLEFNLIKKTNLIPIKDFDGFKILETPGHTRGSISILYKKILFSGDTLFFNDLLGRTDLPTSQPEKLNQSLEMLKTLDYDILCPGHEYR